MSATQQPPVAFQSSFRFFFAFGTVLALALPAQAKPTLALLPIADPPQGPTQELLDLTALVRASAERQGGALDLQPAADSRAWLVGGAEATYSVEELRRLLDQAQAQADAGDLSEAANSFGLAAFEVEKLPETQEAYSLRLRALLHGAYARHLTNQDPRPFLEDLLVIEPDFQLHPSLSRPDFVQIFEQVRSRVKVRPRLPLTVTSAGPVGAVYVNGRPSGTTPVTLRLPAGAYRVGGVAGGARIPTFFVHVGKDQDRAVVLDFAAAQALRLDAGPGLALLKSERLPAIARVGGWLRARQVLATSLVKERGVHFLVGSLYDMAAAALLREGMVRVYPSPTAAKNVDALTTFLLTGQPAPEVLPGSEPPLGAVSVSEERRPPPTWMRPAAYVSAGLALGLGGLATYEGVSAHSYYNRASGMLLGDGTFKPGSDQTAYARAMGDGNSARTGAYVSAGAALLFAGAAGVLYYVSRDPEPPVIRF